MTATPTPGQLTSGSKAPSIKLLDQNGDTVSQTQFKGRKVLVYFYPKDATPGCTIEAVAFSARI